MTTKHTPGPWIIRHGGSGFVGTEDRTVAIAYGDDPDCHADERMQANARLIAAAPAMYAFIEKRAAQGDQEAIQILGGIHANPKGTIPWNAGTSKGWTDKRGYREDVRRLESLNAELLDLLSALECDINTLVYCYERKPDNFGRAVAVAKADAERARAAIAKARGAQ